MAQTRIVVNPKVKVVAEDLMEVTGIDSLSNLFSILVTRYGSHLKNTWSLSGESTAKPEFYHQSVTVNQSPQQQLKPLGIEDPDIVRIASLIENF
jgi:hypothetical protein